MDENEKLSEWFPFDFLPVHEGLYDVEFGYHRYRLKWDGNVFRDAANIPYTLLPADRWRGLANDPDAKSIEDLL